MAKKCPHCGSSNPDDLPFCNSCGEPVDADLRLVMDMKKTGQTPHTEQPKQRANNDVYISRDDDDEEEEKSHTGAIVLAVVVVVVVVAVVLWLVLK